MKQKGRKVPGSRSLATSRIPAPTGSRITRQCPIVGIGASAGGLEAFTRLLKRLPANTGLGIVLVQHLDPQHDSALTQILARATTMPVREVTNNLRVEPNHVYVIPPNTILGMTGGVLKLQPRLPTRTAARSIDSFFESLASDQHERAIGVILSGTASDGTLGLEAIKAEGGITFAQDDSAKYNSMPRSAVGAGCVDFELSPEAIAMELARIAKHPLVSGRPPAPHVRANETAESNPTADESPLPARGGGHLAGKRTGGKGTDFASRAQLETAALRGNEGYQKILLHLRNHSGVDFSLYKPATIHRRITRRTILNKHHTMEEYAGFLRGNPKELDALYSDALIGVTSFFRNADAFDLLRHKVFPKLLQQPGNDPVRIWVLGCSTGQEAYSIAIAFTEAAEKAKRQRRLQVFATDLNEANLHKARHGLYAKSLAQDVSPERLRRFFVEEEGGYRIVKTLREQVVFARQNLISDPPFSRMDLISCRNLMIYLEPSLQKKALPTFHYALKPEGFLFLGASESIGTFTDLFEPMDKKQKIFSKKTASTSMLQLPVRRESGKRPPSDQSSRPLPLNRKNAGVVLDGFHGELNAEREADRVTVNQFAPPGVLVNADLQILQFRGATGDYLEPPSGKASFDLLKMARDGLMLPLRAMIEKAKKENKTVRRENLSYVRNGKAAGVDVEVVPLKNLKDICFLVLFTGADKRPRAGAGAPTQDHTEEREVKPRAVSPRQESSQIARLERDLAEARDYLQSVQEHQEAANEELQASNEEGQSANEELQSLNEELETSKEELESTNEELTTVNEEMVNRNTELNRLNSDLTNLQSSTRLVIVLLGRDLVIRRFSLEAQKQFHLLPGDVGRPISAVRHNLALADLGAVISEVITSVREIEREVQDKAGHWYSLRVRPYLTVDHKVDGAVLVLVDIDALKKTQQLINAARDHAEAIIRTVSHPLMILNSDLRLLSANEAFYQSFMVSRKETEGRLIYEFDRGAWNNRPLRQLLKGIIPGNRSFNNFAFTHNFPRIGRRSLVLNARILNESDDQPKKILLGVLDVTAALEIQTELRISERRYRRLFEAAHDGIIMLDPETRKITEANPFIQQLLGYSRKQLLEKELWQIGLLKDEAASQKAFRELKAKGFIRYEDLPLKTRNGQLREVEFVSNRYRENGHDVIQCNIRDITERKTSENALIASEERFRVLFDLGPVGVYSCNANGTIQEFNQRAEKLWGRKPRLSHPRDLYCGSFKMRQLNGTLTPHRACAMAQVLSGKTPSARDAEVIIERPDASRITIIENVVPLKNSAGKITGAINCFYDISARKQTETALLQARERLAQHAGQLEGQVAKRTAELTVTNRRLHTSLISVGKAQRQNRLLLDESEAMQKKLRELTHQIIAAQEEERKEISRELHDEVVQLLVGVNVELSALAKGSTTSGHEMKRKIAHTQRLVEESVNAVHRFARQLRPAVLDDLGLIPALHAYSKNLAERKKIKINLTAFGGVEALGTAERTVLFRVAQEALNNVVRHAQASLVTINLTKIPGAIQMEVSDNGKSFKVKNTLQAKHNGRLGLVGMRERIEMVGGKLTLDSVPGRGTTVRAEIPFIPLHKKT